MNRQDSGPVSPETIASLRRQINGLKRENSRLEQVAAQAESANKAKTDFLAMISHEIRTPMNAVVGMTQLLLNTELQARQLQYVRLISTAAQSLMVLVNNLLDFSRIEANRMTLYQEPFHLEDEINQLIAIYALTGREKQVRVESEIAPSIRHNQYLGDVHRLRQVLLNLLDNALKFTAEGEVRLQVLPEGSIEDGRLRFVVRDTGIGIAEKDIPTLFQPFTQVDSSSTRRYGGSGLGLAVCARLVERMGGTIGVSSQPGEGATFWFTAALKLLSQPAAVTAAHGSPAVTAAEREGQAGIQGRAAVLIVDDDAANRFLVQEVLEDSELDVVCVGSGAEALAAWRQRDFALVLMDCQMPDMDGYSTTRTMLAEARLQRRAIPVVVALTADGTNAARNKSREAGMVDYLIKPLDFKRLRQVLTTWIAGANVPEPADAVSSRPDSLQNRAAIRPVVNMRVLERLHRDIGDMQKVVQMFLDSLEKRAQELAAACKNDDAAAAIRIAHTLKGSSAQFGADKLCRLCKKVEHLARMGHVGLAGELLQNIDEAIHEVRHYFSENVQP